jgi:SsrA-binding protein
MAKLKSGRSGNISNRRARFDYELGDSLVVGISLTGAETKALRMGHGVLRGAYVTTRGNELWLINSQIMPSRGIPIEPDQQVRSRKLLAKRKEIDKLIAEKDSGKTLVPTELLTKGRYIKLRIAVGRGKKLYDKRQTIKARQADRDISRRTRL